MAEDKKMLEALYDELFSDARQFVMYMMKNDSVEVRKRMLKTDTLRMWYCYYVHLRKEIFVKITSDRWVSSYAYKVMKQRIQQHKLAGTATAMPSISKLYH